MGLRMVKEVLAMGIIFMVAVSIAYGPVAGVTISNIWAIPISVWATILMRRRMSVPLFCVNLLLDFSAAPIMMVAVAFDVFSTRAPKRASQEGAQGHTAA